MLLGSNWNSRLEVTQFLVPNTSKTVSVIREMYSATAPGSLNICSMCEMQMYIFNVPTIILWCTGPLSLGLNLKDSAI